MPSSEYTPVIADVGSLLRSRTVDTNGNELGTFTPLTRPTDAQVGLLIQTAVGELEAQVGSDLPAHVRGLARTAAVYRAASLVEISYFPEQVTTGRSPYDQLHTLWLETLASVKAALAGGGEPGVIPGAPAAPVGAFPTGVAPLDRVLGIPDPVSVPPYSGGLYQ